MFYYKTDKGIVRENNEDSVSIFENGKDLFLVVLDGMGGHNKGDLASLIALETFRKQIEKKQKFLCDCFFKRHVLKAIKKANKEVNKKGTSSLEYNEMGTTIIIAAIHNQKVYVFNVGDSRCYIQTDGELKQVSVDQTYVEFLYKTGKITYEEKFTHPKRHILMNALGTYPSLSIVTKVYKQPFNKILLCSDGLYNMVKLDEIEEIIENKISIEEKVDLLIKRANENGGKDNIAIALWEE